MGPLKTEIMTVLDERNPIAEPESLGPPDCVSQTNANPNLNLVIYAIKFQSCTLIRPTDNRQLMG